MAVLEWLDVVDGDNRVIDRRSREEVHRLQLRHRSTHILLFNSQGELFLQQRSASKDVAPGCWDSSAAGHVESGEDYPVAALRELQEELGIMPLAPLEPLFLLPAHAGTGWEFCSVFRAQHDGPLFLDPEEIAGGDWYSPQTLDLWLEQGGAGLTGIFQDIWRRLRAAA